MLLSYRSLLGLVKTNVITADLANVNGASIDITLGNEILIEKRSNLYVDLRAKESLNMEKINIGEEGYILSPGDFILATSQEIFNLPNDIAAEYKLKSSLARSGLQHLLAGWCDPGWTNSKLTLEFKNVTRYNGLLLRPGMKIGQMVFYKCVPVPDDRSYAKLGQYNGQQTVTPNKGVR